MEKISRSAHAPPHQREYILDAIPGDMQATITVFRWLDFLLHRVKRERLLPLMNYYHDIGWIGEKARKQLMTMARGTLQDVESFSLEEDELGSSNATAETMIYRPVAEYRLSATDHIRSLMFIKKITGETLDGTEMTDLEGELHTMLGI
jgi:flagellar protein FlaD